MRAPLKALTLEVLRSRKRQRLGFAVCCTSAEAGDQTASSRTTRTLSQRNGEQRRDPLNPPGPDSE